MSVVDDRIFGDLKSFKEQFANLHNKPTFDILKARLQPLCKRTLRRQVLPYVRYTKRLPMVQPFTPADSEDRLYHLVSDYLQRDNLQALPSSQRSLMTLVLRKLLASSSFAISGALDSMSSRLRERLRLADGPNPLEEVLEEDFETLDEIAEEWNEEEAAASVLTEADRKAIQQEIDDLEGFRKLAISITHNAKGQALLTALRTAFGKATDLGAAQKAIIFTESRRTQEYLLRVLADSPWKDHVVLFNGSNSDEKSKQIYQAWLGRHQGTDRVTGSRSADMRSALVDYFQDQGQIMIATEAGSEGINLQFCSLVVNYDLPWNPQRIEQRIGRCHRYGQKHDVVVNFLNQANEADQHVFRLLSEKFQLFEGVFGASDEVLGAIESGVDFEKRIADIYQRCRTSQEIKVSFDQLQGELGTQIDEAMTRARQLLLEHFDDEVREKLRVSDERSRQYLNRYERILMQLTRFELRDHAEFVSDSAFRLNSCPFKGEIPLGLYELPRRTGEAHLYRLTHPLAEQILEQAKNRALAPAELTFEYAKHDGKVSVVEPLIGKSGQLNVSVFTVEALDQAEDYLICTGMTDQGEVLDEEVVQRLFSLPGTVSQPVTTSIDHPTMRARENERQDDIRRQISKRNAEFFEMEVDKLDSWADDLKVGLEREIKEFDRQIKEARKVAVAALTLEEKLTGQKQIKAIEAERGKRRRALFDAQDEIDRRREQLIVEVEGKLQQKVTSEALFSIHWHVV